MVFTATVGDRYIAVGQAKDGEGEVALVVRDVANDPKGESQFRVVMTLEQLIALRSQVETFIDAALERQGADVE